MSAQQIKVNINDIVNGIEDEDKLQACYKVIARIAKNDKKQPKPRAARLHKPKKTKTTANNLQSKETVVNQETVQKHDLSLVFLANEIFKSSKPLPEEAILAFNDTLMASALKVPTLPNRL